MPKVKSEKRNACDSSQENEKKTSGWGSGGQLFGSENNENTFQGAGFKDKDKATETLKLLNGRDITYQYQIINSMYNRAKVIYKRTTDKEKRQNLNDAVEIFEKWIDDYKSKGRSKENFSYLPLDIVESFERLAKHYKINETGFLNVYKEVDGDIKRLRGKKVPDDDFTWDVKRNKHLKIIQENIKNNFIPWFETDEPLRGLPTKEHVEMIMFAYSHDQTRTKKCIPLLDEKLK